MDLICPKCGEPYDMDELHEIPNMTFKEAYRAFQSKGCEAIGDTHGELKNDLKARYADALYELLGDDADGAASMLDVF